MITTEKKVGRGNEWIDSMNVTIWKTQNIEHYIAADANAGLTIQAPANQDDIAKEGKTTKDGVHVCQNKQRKEKVHAT